ncbi:MAG: hypothetical protein COU63_02765 [Candidatus Pacebacteria bacterium CG10_big_fil_rev_8_21_14_0_10_36_11]|nr:hypothetical protein [Candidatus Pacearchaeota archaeon]OIP74350.1 MAG: hypothetical protein AUK08_01020 [Candidatus Pacebacteria bacterium CG2_30_36_39]PIR64914.1 MAG: hypothetical protein COU63_02765 [Candidatus Pacebacteria bacterium CG10_big_fil_rev_8_21_14_0_10_36_11]PJC42814.1 MAG: hypothetical protein CO040_02505 [Candidatus Pacebacteria bacterium CG_4_9_14_0_2_um_filter_36_8]
MQLARSRLNRQPVQQNHIVKPKLNLSWLEKWLKESFNLIPTLFIAIGFYLGLWFLMQNVQPTLIQNWIFPNSYLPFHLILGIGNFFFFSFLTHRKFWGFFWSVLIGWLIFIKLQQINLDFWGIGSGLILAIGSSFWWSLVNHFKKTNQ